MIYMVLCARISCLKRNLFIPPINLHYFMKLKPTDSDILGPYYRNGAPFRNVFVNAGDEGQLLRVSGKVTDTEGNLIVGVLLDVWHADVNGRYDHETAEYKFRGKLRTAQNGEYSYSTILPGRYDNGTMMTPQGKKTVYRPGHIHYLISAQGHAQLITQMYFENDPWNKFDPFYKQSLEVKLLANATGGLETKFDIVLKPLDK